jgi:hypothetical protein
MSSSDDEEIYGRPSKRCRTGREIRPLAQLACYILVLYDIFFPHELYVLYQNNEEHEEQEVGASDPSIHMIPQEHPGGHITEPKNEEEPDYNGMLEENLNEVDEIRERRNANELQIANTFAAINVR